MIRHGRFLAGLAVLTFAVAGCGGDSSGGDSGDDAAVQEDKRLVVLNDDKHLQNSDNIVAVVRKEVNKAPLTDALNGVAGALTQEKLVAMNARAAQHDAPGDIAKDFVEENNLTDGLSGGKGDITIGAANFSENQILASIYEQVLDAAGYDAGVKNVQSREVYEPALEKGQLDVMPEYAATMTEFLNAKDNGANPDPLASTDIDETLKALTKIGGKHGLVPLEAAEATDQNAFAVRRDFAAKWDLTNLSDLSKVKGDLVLGGPAECPTRPYCQPGLEKTYGITFTGFKSLDAGGPLTRAAIQEGDVQVGLVFSSDAALAN